MSYPKKVKLFIPWSKAMVDGATVDNPDYGKGKAARSTGSTASATKPRRRRRRRRKNAKKD